MDKEGRMIEKGADDVEVVEIVLRYREIHPALHELPKM